MKKVIAIACGLALSGAVHAGNCKSEDASTLIDIAVAETTDGVAPTFSTLAGLLTSFGLIEPFSTNRNFTVFAPTDAAFTEIAAILPTLSQNQVLDVLRYHVVNGSRDPSEVFAKEEMKMLNKQFVSLSVDGGNMINESEVVASAEACNGWVHVIDQVLIPPVLPESE
ncbi:MAG: fasciclin domain-containing protein [Neptuniibacter sp.]